MIVPPVHQPNFVRHARRIGAQRIVISLHVHDALPLLLLLTHGVAENTALFVLEPFVRGAEFVLDSARHCDIRLSCSGVSTTTSWAPSAPILSYIPSANRAGSPSTWYSGSGCGSTRTCHTPSAGHVRMDRSFSILAGSSGHSSAAAAGASLCPRMTQLCVMGSLRSSIRCLQRV